MNARRDRRAGDFIEAFAAWASSKGTTNLDVHTNDRPRYSPKPGPAQLGSVDRKRKSYDFSFRSSVAPLARPPLVFLPTFISSCGWAADAPARP
jgi:hypothetical protein